MWYVNNCNWKSRTFLKLLKEHNKGGDVLALTWAGNPGVFGSAPVKAAKRMNGGGGTIVEMTVLITLAEELPIRITTQTVMEGV